MRIGATPAAPHVEVDNRLGAPDLAAQVSRGSSVRTRACYPGGETPSRRRSC